MLAIDTSVVVRFLTGDEPNQARRARELIGANHVLVSTTVLLEAEWVLRSAYGLDRRAVLRQMRAFAGLSSVKLDQPKRIAAALDWAEHGLDFADALHLAAAVDCEAMVTFDRRLVRSAADLDGPPVREL